MKKFIYFITILFLFTSLACTKKNTEERNFDYKLKYNIGSGTAYEMDFNNEYIAVFKKVQVVCVKAPCPPLVIENFTVNYNKEYEDFAREFFKNEKSRTVSSKEISTKDNNIINKIIEEKNK